MELNIQDPFFSENKTLIDILCEYAADATYGIGLVAFASADGMSMLFNCKKGKKLVFDNLLENGKFTLVVGTDSITDTEAICRINEMSSASVSFNAKCFIDCSSSSSIFHPKCFFFSNEVRGTLIVGSGNLTIKGLHDNREACAVIQIAGRKEVEETKAYFEKWMEENAAFLFNPNTNIVKDRVALNDNKSNFSHNISKANHDGKSFTEKYSEEVLHQRQKKITFRNLQNGGTFDKVKREETNLSFSLNLDESDSNIWRVHPGSLIYVSEIPRNGDRMSQVNFPIADFKNFFGATPGENGSYSIILKQAGKNISSVEYRQAVSVKSSNYRFELEAAKGKAYPSSSAPIGIFVRLENGKFLYEFLLPDDDKEYKAIRSYLFETAIQKTRTSLRRKVYSYEELYNAVPELKIWQER